jgi:hypothetical protein
MEIHAPERHVQSLRDIVLHLAIVTAGILIALGLEQTVEWYHHRELVAEAKENMLNEIRDNKRQLERQVAQIPTWRQNAIQALDYITDIQQRGKSDIKSLQGRFYQAPLRGASWTTAQSVGALSYMAYSDVTKYAAAYRMQEDYIAAQNRMEEAGITAYSPFAARNRLEKSSPAELEADRAKMMTMVAAVLVQFQTAQLLEKAYDSVLGEKAPAAGSSDGGKK